MAKQNDTGVYQKSNGYWEYRFRQKVNGKMVTHKKTTDAQGNKLKTKKEAVAAREEALVAARASSIDAVPALTRRTVKQVFEEFCEHGRKDRAYQTIRKQDSLWENHLCPRFGKQYVDQITTAEVNDYLSELY